MAKLSLFDRRRRRVRTSLRARSAGKPRLSVHRSGRHIYAQVIDDASGRTLAAASTVEKELRSSKSTKTEEAAVVGRLVAERAKTAGVERVVFDRAGFRYHGRIKSLAEAAREAGLLQVARGLQAGVALERGAQLVEDPAADADAAVGDLALAGAHGMSG